MYRQCGDRHATYSANSEWIRMLTHTSVSQSGRYRPRGKLHLSGGTMEITGLIEGGNLVKKGNGDCFNLYQHYHNVVQNT